MGLMDIENSKALRGYGGLSGGLLGLGDLLSSLAAGVGDADRGGIGRGFAQGNARMTDRFEQGRERVADRDFREHAGKMAGDEDIGDHERQLWQVVSQPGPAGERMRTLLPSLWNAQARDTRRAGGGLTVPNTRADSDTYAFRNRFATEGVDLASMITTLQDPESELRKAMMTTYAEASDPRLIPERDRFRSWVLHHRNLQNMGGQPVPFDSWGYNPENGGYGAIGVQVPGGGDLHDGDRTAATTSEGEPWYTGPLNAAKGLFGMDGADDLDDTTGSSLEDELEFLMGGGDPGAPIPDQGPMSMESEAPMSSVPMGGLMSTEPVGMSFEPAGLMSMDDNSETNLTTVNTSSSLARNRQARSKAGSDPYGLMSGGRAAVDTIGSLMRAGGRGIDAYANDTEDPGPYGLLRAGRVLERGADWTGIPGALRETEERVAGQRDENAKAFRRHWDATWEPGRTNPPDYSDARRAGLMARQQLMKQLGLGGGPDSFESNHNPLMNYGR